MFVYYVDGCLTVYWQLFVLALWVITLLFIAINGRRLIHARAREAALRDAGISGPAYQRLKPNRARHLRWLVFCGALSAATLYGYTEFFATFKCTPDSFLWIAPQYGVPPG